MKNIAQKIHAILEDSLNGKEEGALKIEGIVRNFGLSEEKIVKHREEIRSLLNEMPTTFHKETGGGWSFLNLCLDKDGNQWGEQHNMEELVVLGIAAGMAKYALPRGMWNILPGSVPYVVFDTSPQA